MGQKGNTDDVCQRIGHFNSLYCYLQQLIPLDNRDWVENFTSKYTMYVWYMQSLLVVPMQINFNNFHDNDDNNNNN
jgi:hypothetical protein